jgi:hypothetical protein
MVRFGVSVLLLVIPACSRGTPVPPASSEPSGPPPCETGFTPPAGFEQTESFTEPYADHLGVRQGFKDEEGRELHVFAGIPGEFGEGLPAGGSVTVSTGESAAVLGKDEVWVLVWDTSGPCAARAVLGNGFGRAEFLDSLKVAGIVQRG